MQGFCDRIIELCRQNVALVRQNIGLYRSEYRDFSIECKFFDRVMELCRQNVVLSVEYSASMLEYRAVSIRK